MREAVSWTGWVRVTTTHRDGAVEVEEFPNLITDAGRDLLVSTLGDSTVNAEIRYLALGTGTTAPAVGDTALAAEAFRKQVTRQEDGGTGILRTVTYVAPAEATGFTIGEVGWFAGSSATGAAGSGVLVARVLYSRTKTDVESIQFDRFDTVA